MCVSDNEIKLAKASVIKSVMLFERDYFRENEDVTLSEFVEELERYLDETLKCYEE